MDLNYSKDELAFRDEVRSWLAANLPPDLRDKVANYDELGRDDLLRWHRILATKGWVAPVLAARNGAAPAGTSCSATSSRRNAATRARRRSSRSACAMCAPGAAPLRHRRRRSSASCRASTTATISGARAIRSRARARTSRRCKTRAVRRGRPLRRQRPEDLDHARPFRRLDLLPRAHRLRAGEEARKASPSC